MRGSDTGPAVPSLLSCRAHLGALDVLAIVGVYPLILPDPDGAVTVGQLELFYEPAVAAMNVAIHLLQAPESLANLLEAAGSVALEGCGAILDERTVAE